MKLFVGVSGGPDSMVLLSYIHENKEVVERELRMLGYTGEINLVALNFHHGDPHCNDALILIRKYCESLGIKIKVGYNSPCNPSTEEAWREARYKFFSLIMKEEKEREEENEVLILLLGHHWTDNKTSFIINTLKGSDRGFIPPVNQRGNHIVYRPFHLIDKDIIISYASRWDIPYINDPTNNKSQRGRIESLLPFLENTVNQMPGALKKKYRRYLNKNEFKPFSLTLN